jgi:dUTPase
MEGSTMRISTNHTDQCLRMLKLMQIKPEDYTFRGCLELRNMGPEIRLLAQEKSFVPTGVRIHYPNELFLTVQEKPSAAATSIIVRTVPIQNEDGGEVHVCLLNLGKDDAVIPAGAKLPAQLLALKVYNETADMNYREYLDNTNQKPQG